MLCKSLNCPWYRLSFIVDYRFFKGVNKVTLKLPRWMEFSWKNEQRWIFLRSLSEGSHRRECNSCWLFWYLRGSLFPIFLSEATTLLQQRIDRSNNVAVSIYSFFLLMDARQCFCWSFLCARVGFLSAMNNSGVLDKRRIDQADGQLER